MKYVDFLSIYSIILKNKDSRRNLSMQCSDLELMVGTNETILWRGKPNKKCFLLESIFNPLLPFALIWALIDFGAIFGMGASNIGGLSFFLVPFFLFHLMPVWLYLGGVFFSLKKI